MANSDGAETAGWGGQAASRGHCLGMMVKEFLQTGGLRKFVVNCWVLPCDKRTFVQPREVPVSSTALRLQL